MPLHSVSTSPIKSWRAPRRISLDTLFSPMPLCCSAICIVETKEPRKRERGQEDFNLHWIILSKGRCISLCRSHAGKWSLVCVYIYIYIDWPRLCARSIKNGSPERKIPLRYHFRHTRLFTMENESNVGMI